MPSTGPIAVTFLVYFVILVILGVIAYRRTGDLSDYILGGRKLGSWVSAFSAQASDMSGWLLMGLPGLAYSKGLQSFWMVLGLTVGTYLNWKLVAGPLRKDTFAFDDSLTIPVYFERRFNDKSRLLRLVSALLILVFFTFYTSSALVAGAKLFESVFGFPYQMALLVGTAAVLLYTFIGGFLAVSWTDLLQGTLMILALVGIGLTCLYLLGGYRPFLSSINAKNPDLLTLFTDPEGMNLGWLSIASLAGWGLGYFGQPHILARFMAIESESKVPSARHIAVTWVIVCLIFSVLAGLLAGPMLADSLSGSETEKAFIYLSKAVLHPVPAGVVLAAVLAAIMSTADSQLLVASSAVAEDIYDGFLNREASQGELLWIGRLSVVAISLVAYVIAIDPKSMVLELVSYAWAGFGSTFGPVILLSLYWETMNRNGALAALLTGATTVVLWSRASGGILDLYEIIPGFMCALIAGVLVSLLTESPESDRAQTN